MENMHKKSYRIINGSILIIGCIEMIRYAFLGSLVALITFCVIEGITFLLIMETYRNHSLILHLIAGCGLFVTGFFLNYMGILMDNKGILLQAILCAVNLILVFVDRKRKKHPLIEKEFQHYFKRTPVLLAIGSTIIFLGIWGVQTQRARMKDTPAHSNIWAVPSVYDSTSPQVQEGTVEEIQYETKAYATDERLVTKKANVYLPYNYDPSKQYNILYLMHGTGDDENYWLKTYSYNKVMIDNMIAFGDIEPFIIVTPTFYVEDDCEDDLDQLTYSFQKELRNDLMPAVECKYSTYAYDCTESGFRASRDHRAFAGLSRGAVTTYHSVFCNSLDYFSWFGTFSGSRTEMDYFKEHLQSDSFKDLPIHYLYVSSGAFDFALSGQLRDYKGLLKVEERLKRGENTEFDVYPMRYHSIGSWHLALYNFLPKIFTE